MPESIRRSWPGARGPYGYDMRAAAGDSAAVEIYVYGEIGWEVTAQSFLADLHEAAGPTTPLVVHINSIGGSVFEGLAIYNVLAARRAPVTTIVDGIALSMGSVIALAGEPTQMPSNALMMIHDPSWCACGTPEEMRHQADVLDKIRDRLVGIYVAKSGQDEAEIRRLMAAETWLSGTEAVALGLADEVVEAEADMAAAAKYDFRNCRALPEPLRSLAASAAEPKPRSMTMPNPNPGAADPKDTAQTPTPAAAVVDTAAIQAAAEAAVAGERKRIAEIGVACAAAALPDEFRAALVAEGVTVDTARARVIDELARIQAAGGPEPRSQIRAIVTGDAVDRFRAGVEAALLLRAGLGGGERNEFSGLSLREMARASLDIRGIQSGRMGAMEMVGAAFVPRMAGSHGTSDFINVLSNVAHKAMLKGAAEAEETFPLWTARGVASDFRPQTRVDTGMFPNLPEVLEGAEYTYGTVGDSAETIQVATYGKMFAITRQAIINDDIIAFTRIPQKMGRAALRTVGNLVYAILTGNPTMSDGKALFHADHKNLAGTAAAPSTASLDKMRAAMGTQKDGDGIASLNITPAYLLVPKALEGTTKAVVASIYDTASGDKFIPNSVQNIAQVIAEGRLDSASATAWYAAANPNAVDTIEVMYLDGNDMPYLESKDGWNVDGVEFKVRIDAGVKALGWRGLYKNAGA